MYGNTVVRKIYLQILVSLLISNSWNAAWTRSGLIRYQSQNGNLFTRKCHRCHTLNALQINFPSYSIDLEYLWQTERWLSVCCEAQRAKTVQPVNEEHLCLINLSIFVCDEEAGGKAADHTTTPEYLEARKGLFVFLHTAELFPKGWAVL